MIQWLEKRVVVACRIQKWSRGYVIGLSERRLRGMVGLYVLTRSQVLVSPRLLLRPPRPAHFRPPRPVVLSHAPRRPFASRPPPVRPALLSRLLPKSFRPSPGSGSSLRKVVALAKPERKPLFLAICLLLVSSSVAMTIPLTVGKLIDFFSADDPVSALVCPVVRDLNGRAQHIPYGLSMYQASGILLVAFTTGAACNAARSFLMRMSGMSPSFPVSDRVADDGAHRGQRIVARLRERTYEAALRQEVEFVEKGEGDVLSRLSADSSIVGER